MEDAAVILLLKANCPPWHTKWFYKPSTPHRKFLENLVSAHLSTVSNDKLRHHRVSYNLITNRENNQRIVINYSQLIGRSVNGAYGHSFDWFAHAPRLIVT
ncbi:MAG: hypothetical protein CMJ20_03035 [Phycisphaeraceae bacterium]|nr:hypothetical protein [Phycisphaeraceae bacterium]